MIRSHLEALRAYLFKPLVFHIPSRTALIKKGEHLAHVTYLGAVSVEGHGMYAHAASALLVMVVIEIFSKVEGE